MSARDELAATANGKPTGESLSAGLTEALSLAEKGLHVVGANVFGRGPNASVDVLLNDGSKLTFEQFSDIAKPTVLSSYLVTLTGIYKPFKGADAGMIAATIHQLAKHHGDAEEDGIARELGSEYLRVAPVHEVDMSDQAQRWSAFAALGRLEPTRDAGEDRSAAALAAAGTVLRDPATGKRYVRTGWFQSYVKREVGGVYSPAKLAIQMERVGWTRPNSQCRVKATNPTDGRALSWAFYVIELGWEDGQVTAGYVPYARTHTYARKNNEPAVTRNPAGRLHVDGTPYAEPPGWMPGNGDGAS